MDTAVVAAMIADVIAVLVLAGPIVIVLCVLTWNRYATLLDWGWLALYGGLLLIGHIHWTLVLPAIAIAAWGLWGRRVGATHGPQRSDLFRHRGQGGRR